MTDEQLIEAMARRLAKDDGANWEAAHFGETPSGETPEEMRDYYRGLATAAVATLRKTHHLIPRAAGDDGELVGRLRYTYEHGIFVAAENGMLAGADEAADRIAALEAELAEKDALLRKCGEGLAGPNAWLERWASHVGGCHGGSLCQCGLTLACLESATTLAKIKDATDAD